MIISNPNDKSVTDKLGLHEDVPAKEYHSNDWAMSRSTLLEILKSPLHFKHMVQNPKKQTTAMRFGDVVHTAILEREKFAEKCIVAPAGLFSKVTGEPLKNKQAEGKEFLEKAGKRTIIMPHEVEKVGAMVQAVWGHKKCPKLLKGRKELTSYWIDPDTNVLCKSRFDCLTDEGIIVDLKTTSTESPGEFGRSIGRYKYHVQAAFYMDGLKYGSNNEIDPKGFVFMVVEKEAPHAVALYTLDAQSIEKGREIYKRALGIYADCTRRNEWPGYDPSVRELSLPEWALDE